MRSLILKYFDEEVYRYYSEDYQKEQMERLEGLSDQALLDEYTDSIMDRFRGDYD
jgi:hypothetical protein